MTPDQLLKECAKLTHAGRIQRMVELGRLATSDESVRVTIAQLARSGVYQRILATQTCYGSRDSAQILQALSDPSRSVRSLALNIVPRICTDAELQTALDVVPLEMKIVLLRKLGRRRRQAVIDGYLETLVARQDGDLKKLLRFGSSALVERSLGLVLEYLEMPIWRRLAAQHPALVVTQLRAQVAATTTLDPRLLLQVNAVLPLLADVAPDLALELVQTFVAVVPLSRLDLQVLVCRRPNEVAALVLQANEQSNVRFGESIERLETEHLLALCTHYPGNIDLSRFHKLSVQQRLALYTACERGWRNAEGVLSITVVGHLPAPQRLQEGRRNLELPALATRPLERLPFAAFLPWDEACALLDTSVRSPDADLRGAALHALITSTRYQRTHLTDALQFVIARRNEQDPVRCRMLIALADLPHGIWRLEHLDDLARIILDALDATDLSTVSARSLERLVTHLFPFHPEWSARQIASIYRKRGRVSLNRLDGYLSDEHMRHIASELAPLLQSWQQRESDGLLISLAHALGRRLRVFNELLDQLTSVLDHTLGQSNADWILRLLREHAPERLAISVPRLLAEDKSCIVIPTVSTYLHRHRQDLLTPFLGQHAYKGRFSTGRTRFVPSWDDDFYRWTPEQQEIFARTLLEIANDQQRATYELLSTIRRLALMPALNPAPLIKLASDNRQPVREAALRALGTLDAGQGIPTLLEALNDERARIAIYALRNSLLSMPQTEALTLLRNAPLTRVTVAKEVVRLIGDLKSEAAYRELLAIDQRDLHRDVRVALLRAFWPYVEQYEVWEVFNRAAQASDVALARGVVHIPADGISVYAEKRLASLVAILLAHPESEVRIDVLQRCYQDPLTDNEHLLFTRLLALMSSILPDECKLAAQAVFALYTDHEAGLVGEAMLDLLSNRRALLIACQKFVSVLLSQRQYLLPTTRAVLAALATDRLTLALRIEIIVRGLPWEEVGPELLKLADSLHADALSQSERMLLAVAVRPDAQLYELEQSFAASSDERLRRLALAALIAQSRQASGWSDNAIARLETYRQDPSALVAEAAQFTFII
jgi:hypothetical protein